MTSVHTALNKLRRRGVVAPRVKKDPTYFQIHLHPAAAARLNKAAFEKGLEPADLAKILLHQASRALT